MKPICPFSRTWGYNNSDLCSFINCRLMGALLASVSLSLLGFMQRKAGKFLQVTSHGEETHQPSKAHFFGTSELEGASLGRGKQSPMSLMPPCVPLHKTKIFQAFEPSFPLMEKALLKFRNYLSHHWFGSFGLNTGSLLENEQRKEMCKGRGGNLINLVSNSWNSRCKIS